ncbi:MAG: 5-methyltetrahydropteroyltriglutamate--homocysteine S-methyltransferase [Deltaproteobacteria bacterium]|nr:5-methyltetrahydropteroyltriglutamate--homocysteine S-methyltransferase [Deltaproteobacteria bacterium]MBI2532576.1 5-methyltetrahydropteroyltriglutamate--homocysteine S-methyltransferase [Deltaproteobacteria bacterium]
MAEEKKAPFRANHVGSLLRPPELRQAREQHQKGEITAAELREVEDRCIRDAVKMQEEVGMQGITDGEFRRNLWHADFLSQFQGIKVVEGLLPESARHFQNPDADVQRSPTQFVVTGKLGHPRGIETDNFKFLAGVTKQTPKQCIPSPSLVHFRTGRGGVDKAAYPDMEQFFADLARVYREEIAGLAAAGCTYLQIDDVNFAYLCDPKMREGAKKIGEDPDKLPALYARLINESIKERPANMVVCTHLCRGNFRSSWVAEGGYDPVAEVLFNELELDGYFLEFDTPRAGNFAPLRYLPKGKMLILGLVTSKTGALENPDDLKRRIDEASKLVPLDQLGISPQCGFSSTVLGNKLTIEDQIAKLKLVVQVAREVWG